MAELPLAQGLLEKQKRKSYTRDDKLKVVSYYKDNGNNLYRTCQYFNQSAKNVLCFASPMKGVHTNLYTWCPFITLSKVNENSIFASCSVSSIHPNLSYPGTLGPKGDRKLDLSVT